MNEGLAERPAKERLQSEAEGRTESHLERLDRNLTELMGELRVALPGVQVLFAFLLVVPFNQRFGRTSSFERGLYFAALVCTLLASILLIAPTVIHRLEFRQGEKAYVVDTANRLSIAGLIVLAVAMTCAIALVTSFLFGTAATVVVTVFALLSFTMIWYIGPQWRRRSLERRGQSS
jgi:hypothetical protein